MDQTDQKLIFECSCGYRDKIEQEELVIEHIKQCEFYQSTSQVQELLNQHSFRSINNLLEFRADLKALIDRVNEQLFNQGYEKAYETGYDILKLQSKKSQQFQEERKMNGASPVKCTNCLKIFDSSVDFAQLWYLETCCHLICRPCFSILILEYFVLREGQLVCTEQNCHEQISRNDIISVLGEQVLVELDYKLLLKSQNIVTCTKCKRQFGFEKGDENSVVKDSKTNKQLEGVLLQHYIENRFTCPQAECKTEQCMNCQATPYHIGYNCEEFKLIQKSRKCRFCDVAIQMIDESQPRALQDVCTLAECLQRNQQICHKVHPCGHCCSGYRGEVQCLPCLEEGCIKPSDQLQQNADDLCNICFTEALKSSPCIRVKCGHIYHQECITKRLETRWNGPRIVFNFCLCPLCKKWLEFPIDNVGLTKLMKEFLALYEDVKVKVIERLKVEGRDKDKELCDPNHPFFNKPLDYGMAIFAYYNCFKCNKPYFGGLKSCQLNIEDDRRQFDKSELVCPMCCPQSFATECKKHGNDYIEFKCKFCCSVALWFCWGTTHFCDPCHKKATEMAKKTPKDLPQCKTPDSCPLKIVHKQNGEECGLGCGLCRQEKIQENKGK